LEDDVYGLKAGSIMEEDSSIYVKDKTKDFDDYIPCRKEGHDKKHA